MVEHGESMVKEIFDTYDSDKDGWLANDEFNRIQEATEGAAGVYNPGQFNQLLDMVDPHREKEGLSMNILQGMYLNPQDSDEFRTELPGDYYALLTQGQIKGSAMPGSEELLAKMAAPVSLPEQTEEVKM